MYARWLLPFVLVCVLPGQKKAPARADEQPAASGPRRFTEFPVPDPPPLDPVEASRLAVAGLLAVQEGDGDDQWPYEGVYREDRGQLPVGYRVGGTAITVLGLVAAPGYADDEPRQAAVGRALR